MKNKIKALFLGMMSFLMMTNLIQVPAYAATYVTGSVHHDDWWVAHPSSGRTNDHEGQLQINGENAFCIDAFTEFRYGVEMNLVDWSTVGISKDLAKELSLIAYFGTQVPERKDIDWYAVTQGLIWKTIHSNSTDICYVESDLNPDYETTKRLWNEILEDVAEYKKTPSFKNQTIEINAEESLTLTDTNNSLKNMIVKDNGGLDVTINGDNELVIKAFASSEESTTITLQRNINPASVGTSLVYYNGVDQSLAMFKIADPLQVKINVKVNKFGQLELTKYNDDKSATIPETTYHITGPNDFDETHTTDVSGKIVLEKLPIGDYQAVETQSGNGYLINVTPIDFTIQPNQTTTVDLTNTEPTGSIELTKSIDVSKTNGLYGDSTLDGNTYELYAKEKITNKAGTKTFYEKDELISAKKTDSNGKIKWEELPLGHYYIKESATNDTLFLNTNVIDVEIKCQDQTVSKVIVTKETEDRVNMQKIQVFKSGEKEGISGFVKGLQGAEFTFKLKSEVDHVGWEQATTYAKITTDKDGKANTPYLPYGQYHVKETVTPKDYITAPDFLISITDDYTEYEDIEQVKKININNKPFTSQLKLVKVDKESGKVITLNSASFKIKDSNGDYVVQKVGGVKYDTFTTNSQNQVVSSANDLGEVILPLELDAGDYTIEEIKVPDGFLELEEPLKFTITNQYDYDVDEDDAPILKVVVENEQPMGKIIITKTDKSNALPMEFVEFELTAKEDIIDMIDGSVIFEKGSLVSKGVTNAEGKLIIDGLHMGKYELKETLTKEGYVLSEEVHEVVLKQTDTTTKEYVVDVNLTNIAPIGEIHIYKTDKDTKEYLSGVTFQLTAKEDIYSLDGRKTLLYKAGDTVSRDASENGLYMTNELGEIHISELPLGLYELKEVKTLDGYYSSQESYEIDLRSDHSDKVIYRNELEIENKKTIVEITKVDATNSKELEGAHLSVLDKDGKVIEEWISSKEAYIIRGLKLNEEYILREDLAPLGYEKATDIQFTINDDGKPTQVVMKDELIPTVPQTGDDTQLGLYIALCGLSVTALLLVAVKHLKDKKELE